MYLPESQKKILRKDYIIRLALVFLVGLCSVVVSGIIFFFPSALVAYREKGNYDTQLISTQANTVDQDQKVISEILNLTKYVSDGIDRPTVISNIKLIISLIPKGIKISSIDMSYGDKITINLNGVASTRETLINLRKNVETNENIKMVELPVSDLAKSKNISFIIKIIMK